MKYREIKVYTTQEKLDGLIELFAIYEEIGIEICDPRDAEQFSAESAGYLWNYVDDSVLEALRDKPHVTFYLAEGDLLPQDLAEALKSPDYEMISAVVDDQDWLHKWEEYYVPTKISGRFVVKPLWREYEPKPGEDVIVVDPGLAFGTGTHPTSFLCVRHMEKTEMKGKAVLDVGCGTGILSLAAAKLGAGEIMAVDLDPEAVRSTQRNAELNGCADLMTVREGDLTKGLEFKADVVAANLMADLVMMLTESIARHCNPGAVYISSGILDEKEEIVSACIRDAGFEIEEVLHDGGWCSIKAIWKKQ